LFKSLGRKAKGWLVYPKLAGSRLDSRLSDSSTELTPLTLRLDNSRA
jgi:hypothetical protein